MPPEAELDFDRPRDELVRRRWIPTRKVDQARRASEIMVEWGSVYGTRDYAKRDTARWRARALIALLVDLRMYERWELREHVERTEAGEYRWAVEYLGRSRA
jgi:hypothetical protein